MQLFLWQFPGDDKVRTFQMCCIVISNRPSTSLALLETVKVEDNANRYPTSRETILENTYVYNTFKIAPDGSTACCH